MDAFQSVNLCSRVARPRVLDLISGSLVAASEVNGGWILKIPSALGDNSTMKNQGLCDISWATKYGQYTWIFNLSVTKFLDPKLGTKLCFNSTSQVSADRCL